MVDALQGYPGAEIVVEPEPAPVEAGEPESEPESEPAEEGDRRQTPDRRKRILHMVAKPAPAEPVEDPAVAARRNVIGLVEDFLASLKAGTDTVASPQSVLVFWMQPEPDGAQRPRIWRRHTTLSDQIAYGMLIQDLAMKEWRGDVPLDTSDDL